MKDNNLTFQQDMAIKSIHEDGDKKGILIIKGAASVYRTPEGFLHQDRDNELVSINGMDLDSYRDNPILIYNHDFATPVGKITSIENVNGVLEITAEVHKLTGMEHIYEAVQKRIVKSLSVGIIPKSFLYHDINGQEVLEIERSELVEISLAPVQSNRSALFNVTAEKSVHALADTLALQNGMSSDELKDYINQKALGMKDITTKEVELEEVKVEAVEEPKAEPVIEPVAEVDKPAVEPVVEPVTEPVAETKEEPKTFDEAALVSAIITAEETKAALLEKKAEDKIQADLQAEADAKSSKEARLKDAFAYIQETKDAIIGTPNDEFDADKIEAFYEAVSGAAEAIETKIGEIIIEATTPKEAE